MLINLNKIIFTENIIQIFNYVNIFHKIKNTQSNMNVLY